MLHTLTSSSLTGKLVSGPFEGHTGEVLSVAFSPDGRLVASGSGDHSIRIWNAESGENDTQRKSRRLHFLRTGNMWSLVLWIRQSVYGMLKRRDGARIVSGSDNRTIRVWDTDSGSIFLGPLQGHTGPVNSVAFSPDGQIIAGSFEGHTRLVTSVAFSPDGKYIASGSRDRSVRVWDAESGQAALDPFMGHTDYVSSVAFRPCGRYLVSGSRGGTIRIWSVDDGEDMLDVPDTSCSPSLSTNADTGAASAGRAAEISGLRGGDMRLTLPKECTAANWRVSEDGWIRGDRGELLIWIPEYVRDALESPDRQYPQLSVHNKPGFRGFSFGKELVQRVSSTTKRGNCGATPECGSELPSRDFARRCRRNLRWER